ncbi:pyrroline-5-carboxylate reductase [Nitratifractor salsuginis]|uniref:Pyrroline-5-carboxylate reductase n=1 Tax=Nitratifractor salsuginis (strain DSM 16511 / JCM 12458 / E9I37-1) TaxID=749222 RepID=E6WZY6_NITSE|nr:pyrroline-5-carboxylate reductase [Nitratifractor salsuginis]ADV45644.1 pyrroline-5-carboxylate reductase [Nitratifractor salsuginis DSM 16511]
MKILLIGAGNMGGAMLEGLREYDVTVVEAYEPRRKELAALYPNITLQNTIPPLDGYVVLLAIKPQSLDALEVEGRAEALISILAGTPLARLKEKIDAEAYIRAMPNIAALKRKSVTSVTGDESFKEEALKILSSIGKAIWLNSEKELDIATGIGGSAPAWMALVAEALADGAVNLGLPRAVSYEYVAALMDGMGALLEEEHPALLKDKVMSPGGTTAAGYAKLEEGGVRDSFIKAMEACYRRSLELGK